MLQLNKSAKQHQLALQTFPGGVNSPVRAFHKLGSHPIHFQSAHGPYLVDVDGHEYLDFCNSWGPLILGHQDPDVFAALQRQMSQGFTFGATSSQEVEYGQFLQKHIPGLELLRFVTSGTEATMSAIRLARFVTQRSLFVKFEGCYHGHYEDFLVEAGSGVLTLNLDSGESSRVLVLPYNDCQALVECFQTHGSEIAAVIIEPIAANMGLIPSHPEFLSLLRTLCTESKSVLIFDEVMSGFRVHPQGATALYHIQPDLLTFGKIVGGGFPAAVYGGKKSLMSHVAPLGGFYQAGTLSGHPVAMVAGLTTLKKMFDINGWALIEELGQQLDQLMASLTSIPYRRVGGFFSFFPGLSSLPHSYQDLQSLNHALFKHIFWHMIQEHIYISPSPYEVCFLNVCQKPQHIEKFVRVLSKALHDFDRCQDYPPLPYEASENI